MARSSRLEAGNEAAMRDMCDLVHEAKKHQKQIEDIAEVKTGRFFGVDLNTKVCAKNFSLNCSKAVKKKLEAANRKSIYDVSVNLDGIYIACQTGLYELVRSATHVYYTQHKTGYNVIIDVSKDKSGNVVQVVYKVRKCAGTPAYTLSLYHTKSTLYVNGKGAKNFAEKDWVNILDLIFKSADVHPSLLNERLKKQLVAVNNSLIQANEQEDCSEVASKAKKDGKSKEHSGQPHVNAQQLELPDIVHERKEVSQQAEQLADPQASTLLSNQRRAERYVAEGKTLTKNKQQAEAQQTEQPTSLPSTKQSEPIRSIKDTPPPDITHSKHVEQIWMPELITEQLYPENQTNPQVEHPRTSLEEIYLHPSLIPRDDAANCTQYNLERGCLDSSPQLPLKTLHKDGVPITESAAQASITLAEATQDGVDPTEQTKGDLSDASLDHQSTVTALLPEQPPGTRRTKATTPKTAPRYQAPIAPDGKAPIPKKDKQAKGAPPTTEDTAKSHEAATAKIPHIEPETEETVDNCKTGQTESVDQNALLKLQQELEEKEKTLKEKERKIKQMEKSCNQRTKDVEKKLAQHETTKRYAFGLESKVKDLQEVNELLQQTTQLFNAQAKDNVEASRKTAEEGNSDGRYQDQFRQRVPPQVNQWAHPKEPASDCSGNNKVMEAKMEAMEAKILLAVKESENRMLQMMVNLNLQISQQQNLALVFQSNLAIHSNLQTQQALAQTTNGVHSTATHMQKEVKTHTQHLKTGRNKHHYPGATPKVVKKPGTRPRVYTPMPEQTTELGNWKAGRPLVGVGANLNTNTWASWNQRASMTTEKSTENSGAGSDSNTWANWNDRKRLINEKGSADTASPPKKAKQEHDRPVADQDGSVHIHPTMVSPSAHGNGHKGSIDDPTMPAARPMPGTPLLNQSYSTLYKRWPHDKERSLRDGNFKLSHPEPPKETSLPENRDEARLHIRDLPGKDQERKEAMYKHDETESEITSPGR